MLSQISALKRASLLALRDLVIDEVKLKVHEHLTNTYYRSDIHRRKQSSQISPEHPSLIRRSCILSEAQIRQLSTLARVEKMSRFSWLTLALVLTVPDRGSGRKCKGVARIRLIAWIIGTTNLFSTYNGVKSESASKGTSRANEWSWRAALTAWAAGSNLRTPNRLKQQWINFVNILSTEVYDHTCTSSNLINVDDFKS